MLPTEKQDRDHSAISDDYTNLEADMVESILVLGTGASSGKTMVSVGIIRNLVDRGVRARPFKAIAIARNRSHVPGIGWFESGIPHHFLAAGLQFDFDMNPVLVVPRSDGSGDLYIRGENRGTVRYGHKDVSLLHELEVEQLRAVKSAIKQGYDAVSRSADVVVMEGAASPVEFDPELDIPNIETARYSGAEIVLCSQGRSGVAAALIGTLQCLPVDVRTRVAGFILTNCTDPELSRIASDYVGRQTKFGLIGHVERLDLFDGPTGVRPIGDEVYIPWAAAVEKAIGSWIEERYFV